MFLPGHSSVSTYHADQPLTKCLNTKNAYQEHASMRHLSHARPLRSYCVRKWIRTTDHGVSDRCSTGLSYPHRWPLLSRNGRRVLGRRLKAGTEHGDHGRVACVPARTLRIARNACRNQVSPNVWLPTLTGHDGVRVSRGSQVATLCNQVWSWRDSNPRPCA